MNFIGKDCDFNNKLQSLITIEGYTIVSYINDEYTVTPNIDNLIQIFSVDNHIQYYESLKLASIKSFENYLETTNTCTNIFLYMHEYIDVKSLAEIINTFDKNNMVDNIMLYPKAPKLKLRNDIVENLPWQKKLNESLS